MVVMPDFRIFLRKYFFTSLTRLRLVVTNLFLIGQRNHCNIPFYNVNYSPLLFGEMIVENVHAIRTGVHEGFGLEFRIASYDVRTKAGRNVFVDDCRFVIYGN
jgi:hypothetical protein